MSGEAFGLPQLNRARCPECGAPTIQGTASELRAYASAEQLVELDGYIAMLDAGDCEAWLCRRDSCRNFGIFSPWMLA